MVGVMRAPAEEPPAPYNRSIVADFVRLFYGERRIRQAMETWVRPDYVQHNPGIADGREAAIAALEDSLADPSLHLDVERVLVDGDFAVIHLHAWRDGERGGAVMDLYRLEEGRIVEHWDVIQQIGEDSANPHPFF